MAKALITGSHGFIGSHLIYELEKKDIECISLPRELLYNPSQLISFLIKSNPEYIFHTAAYGNMSNQKSRDDTIFTNIFTTWQLLESSIQIPYKAFINFGSSSEYGKKNKPMTEDMIPEADTFYGASKIAATFLSRAFSKQFNKPIVTIRPFSVYGPGESEFRFIPQIIKHILDFSSMNVDIDGVHDWIYIDDLISGVLKVIENIENLQGKVVNIGTGIQTKNIEIVNILENISHEILDLKYQSHMREDDSQVWIDGSTVLRDLDWKPTISLEEGLSRCYDFYKSTRSTF